MRHLPKYFALLTLLIAFQNCASHETNIDPLEGAADYASYDCLKGRLCRNDSDVDCFDPLSWEEGNEQYVCRKADDT